MIGAAGLILATALSIQTDDRLPLVINDRVVVVRRSEAEALHASPNINSRLRAALDIALGTAIDNRPDGEQLTVQERERFRWQRRPIQAN